MNFGEIFLEQLNNPSCSMISGAFVGMTFTVRLIFYMVISYFLIKAVEKLAFEPFLDWIKNKFKVFK